jgi:hypothetical protein
MAPGSAARKELPLVSNDHQQVSKVLPDTACDNSLAVLRDDPFSRLVAAVAADPDNPFNIERYLWVLEEPAQRCCATCGVWFDPWFGYDGEAPHGPVRRYCSRRCAARAAYERHRARMGRDCEIPYSELVRGRCACRACGAAFDPAVTYDGRPFRSGRRRTCCSRECQARLARRSTTGFGSDQMGTAA